MFRAALVLACTFLIACAAVVAVDRQQAESTKARDADEIPIGAHIIAVSDVFDAIVSDRPYRDGRSVEEAIAELHRCAGTQFDAAVVDAFTAVVRERERV